MAPETESIATLLATREYARVAPLLKAEIAKHPHNPRIRFQYADSLAGSGRKEEAIEQYEATAKLYDDAGLTVQAIAVRKKSEKLSQQTRPGTAIPGTSEPLFATPVAKSVLFEALGQEDLKAFASVMELESHDEGSVILVEGEPGESMYVIASGEVRVYTSAGAGRPVYLAKLGEGDFFGEVSVLTGRPRTATITAAQRTDVLRIDKVKLEPLLKKHPIIRRVLEEFYARRAKQTVEAMVEAMKKGS